MNIAIFTHSLVSDWNHGNAHFLRGLLRALRTRGHGVWACERRGNWSTVNLVQDHGAEPVLEFARRYPDLEVRFYDGGADVIDEVDALTRGADLVLVHEFNDPELVGAVGAVRRRRRDFALLFHDTHHRAVTAPHEMMRLNLESYDGVLAYGAVLAEVYRTVHARPRVWVFHEAADVTTFRPLEAEQTQDVVWIGNWGDEERTHELWDYLIESARRLPELRFVAHGVRYPEEARRAMAVAGIDFRGWVANYEVPRVYAASLVTIHVPRGPYLRRLPGIPTIRPFEALACGIPLVCSPWADTESLFRAGRDFLVVDSPAAMRQALLRLAGSPAERQALAESGLETIRARHTCDHRAEQLEQIHEEVVAVA